LGREAAPKPAAAFTQANRVEWIATAPQPNGAMRRFDKPPRHKMRVYLKLALK
jgi:hypothetical protein